MTQRQTHYRYFFVLFELVWAVYAVAHTMRHVFIASGGKLSSRKGVTPQADVTPAIAFGYVRQSYSRYALDDEPKPESLEGHSIERDSPPKGRHDSVSIDRQKHNIEVAAARGGYHVEWFIEEEGHRSGRDLSQRPEMTALLARLEQTGVRAVIANDMARLFRRGWRMGQLLEVLQQHGIKLILAAPGRELDLSTPEGKMIASFMAMVDEWYVEDVRQRALDHQRWRREQGLTLGLPPCGAIRRDGKMLIPSPFGAWLLADGSLLSGHRDDMPPQFNALWRGYYEAVQATLELYSHNEMGYKRLARELRRAGWFYRSNRSQPKLPQADDVRRVIAAWPQYAGLVVVGASKSRRLGDVPLDWVSTGHSIFDEALLRQVAWVEADRRRVRAHRAIGSKAVAYPYPLRGLVLCAQCRQAKLSGTDKNGRRAYRHAQRPDCATQVRSVSAPDLENGVLSVLSRLQFSVAVDKTLTAAQVSWVGAQAAHAAALEAQRRMTLYRLKRQMTALNVQLEEGILTEYAYHQQRAALLHRQEAASCLPHAPSDSNLDMGRYIQSIRTPIQLWEKASPTERQTLMALLFENIWYDLDKGQITNYLLQPWAQHVFRVAE